MTDSSASEARMTRGLEIVKSKVITENNDGSFSVPSQGTVKSPLGEG